MHSCSSSENLATVIQQRSKITVDSNRKTLTLNHVRADDPVQSSSVALKTKAHNASNRLQIFIDLSVKLISRIINQLKKKNTVWLLHVLASFPILLYIIVLVGSELMPWSSCFCSRPDLSEVHNVQLWNQYRSCPSRFIEKSCNINRTFGHHSYCAKMTDSANGINLNPYINPVVSTA